MALLTKTLTDFVTELEDGSMVLIGLTFKPVTSGSPTRFIAVFEGSAGTNANGYEVWDVGP